MAKETTLSVEKKPPILVPSKADHISTRKS